MLPIDQRVRQERRIAGNAQCEQTKVPSYQELLDQALDDTFPASDPPAISAALYADEPRTTARDDLDWTLKPGACPPVGQPCGDRDGKQRSERCEGRVEAALQIDAARVPAGPCEIEQSSESAWLFWGEQGEQRQVELGLDVLKSLLASGKLWRHEPA